MSERTDALKLAQKLLDEPNTDPDDNLRVLSRQLIRCCERNCKLIDSLQAVHDPDRDMIEANRDSILRIHEEGVKRISKRLEQLESLRYQLSMENVKQSLAVGNDSPLWLVFNQVDGLLKTSKAIVKAINTFHPMHGESWCGWPDGSDK